MKKNEKKDAPKPFGLNFLETPTEDELKRANGGVKTISGPPRFHSMDIILQQGHPHFDT
jgi:hypothetical protein